MPIYEYQCSKCGHEYEIIQKMSDAPVEECQSCHQSTAVRLVSAPGFQLKGTGWYETDFKHKGKPPVKSESKEGVASDTKTSTDSSSSTKNKDKNK